MRRRGVLACATAVMIVAASPSTGRAQGAAEEGTLSEAADVLRGEPVYVAPRASSILSEADADGVRDEIEGAEPTTGDIYVAVLPEGAGDPQQLALDLHDDHLQREGTYAVVSGDDYFAGTDIDMYGEEPLISELMSDSVDSEGSGDASAVLTTFVGELETTAQEIRSQQEPGPGPTDDGGFNGFFLIVLLVGGAFAFFSWRKRRQRADLERRHLEEVREAAMEDLVALGDDLRALDLDVEMPGVDPAAKEDYVKALGCYERATADIDKARRVQDLEPVAHALEEGRYAMASAKARLEGREPPERRAPCFFDPRHGPSARDVDWTPPHGSARRVPACTACAAAVDEGREPQAREVLVNGRPTPYWDAPYYYGPWAGGYFGGFGLLEGLFIGSMLGGAFDHGHGDFGGDFGGGDWGGGDFGGGDFGGGDFGGGDF